MKVIFLLCVWLFLCCTVAGQTILSSCRSTSDVIEENEDLSFFNLIYQGADTFTRTEFRRPTSRIATFVPIDKAWENLEANGIAFSDIQSNTTLLNLILDQHILQSVPPLNSLVSVSGELDTRLPGSPLNTSSGLGVNGGQVSVVNSVGKIENAKILEVVELCLSRGAVFVVDQVLLPPELISLLGVEPAIPIPTTPPAAAATAPIGGSTAIKDPIIISDAVPPTNDEDPIIFNPLLVDEEPILQDFEDPIFFNPELGFN